MEPAEKPRRRIPPETNLHSFVELDAEVLEDAEALVQLKRVLVLTEEIDESVSLFTQFQPAPLQLLKRLCGTLRGQTHAVIHLSRVGQKSSCVTAASSPAGRSPAAAGAPALHGLSPPGI